MTYYQNIYRNYFLPALFIAYILIPNTVFADYRWQTPMVIDGSTKVTAEDLFELRNILTDLVLINMTRVGTQKTIAGAVRMPSSRTTPQDLRVLLASKATPVAFYCENAGCARSFKGAKQAVSLGYSNVYWLRGGLAEWESKGLPLAE